MSKLEQKYILGLSLIKGIGPRISKQLIKCFPDVEEIFYEDKRIIQQKTGIRNSYLDLLDYSRIEAAVDFELEFMDSNKIELLTILDEDYPSNLREIVDAPASLFYKGTASFNGKPNLAVVGTRNATREGLEICESIVGDLSSYKINVISGLAYGVDVKAHETSLNNGIDTIGVLGHGLDMLYPTSHQKIAAKMLSAGGLLTEFSSNTKIERANFPIRNRIVAGVCDAVLIIESAEKGGSLITAKLANSYNRDVFAVPGSINKPYSKGCNELIKTHLAQLITSPNDLINYLGLKAKTNVIQKDIFELNPKDFAALELQILKSLQQMKKIHFDYFSQNLNVAINEISSSLFNLEMLDVIDSLPGNYYQLR